MAKENVLVSGYVIQSIISTNRRCVAKGVELHNAVRNKARVVAIANEVDGHSCNDDPQRIDTSRHEREPLFLVRLRRRMQALSTPLV